MLTHPTLDLLQQLGLNGMAKAFAEIEASAEATTLTHPEWLGLLLDREVSYRRDRRLLARLRYARLRHQASIEDVDYRAARGLDRALFQKLAEGNWMRSCGPVCALQKMTLLALSRPWPYQCHRRHSWHCPTSRPARLHDT